MEKLISRKNAFIRHLRALGADSGYREKCGEYVCDGAKLLQEAISFGAEISAVLWKKSAMPMDGLCAAAEYIAAEELFDYASPMKNSPGPLFTVRMPAPNGAEGLKNAVILEGVQDPGNVGTVIRTAGAFGISAVILTDGCADLYNPKTVRASMGAIFRQRVERVPIEKLKGRLTDAGLLLYGAALSDLARDVREIPIASAAVAIGSEGRGLSRRMLDMCDGEIIIPMRPESESLNAAVAASVLMWEMSR